MRGCALFVWAPLLVVGCALAPSQETISKSVFGAQDWELCFASVKGSRWPALNEAVRSEIRARAVDCNLHWRAVQARLEIERDQANKSSLDRAQVLQTLQAVQAMQRQAPPPPPAPAQTRCTTRIVNNTVVTDCTTY